MAETKVIDMADKFAVIQTHIPFKCKLSSNKWEDIHLYSLPTNYGMLMMNIDYPDKAKDNPNGSLFMKPSNEILLDTASDIGLLYFGGILDWYTIFPIKSGKDVKESLLHLYKNNDLVNLLLEFGSNDLDNGQWGDEIELETRKRKSLNTAKSYDGSPIGAIDNYISSSIPIVQQLLRAVAGNDVSGIKEITKTIHLFNQVNGDNITKYLDKNNSILKLLKENEHERLEKQLETNMEIFSLILKVLRLISEKAIKCLKIKKFDELVDRLKDKDAYKMWKTYKREFFDILSYNGNIIEGEKELDKIYRNHIKPQKNNDIDDSLADSILYSELSILNEDDYDSVNNEALEKLETFDFDTIYTNVKHSIAEVMGQAIISKPEDWYIILNAKTRMEKLKEACDKEINEKIELICRTVLNGSSSIGEKFKAAISKHPMRASGLKNIWAKYSDDLNDRIESRIRSISGNNGNSNMFVPIHQFLTVTYPSLIAMMVTWKCAFMLLKLYLNRYPITNIVIDELQIENQNITKAEINIQRFINSKTNTTT